MALHNKILIRENLQKRGRSGDHFCVFYPGLESVDHIFFPCPAIKNFCSKLLTLHPQQSFLNITSLLEF
jgi:zinc-binding in reverse transcriptase